MDAREYDGSLKEAESDLERLRIAYEQYFMGLERIEPQKRRQDFDRRIRLLRKHQPRSTALRFRYQQLQARYVTFQQHWNRICRKIEEGTYERDLQRARKRRTEAEQRPATKTFEVDLTLADDLDQEIEAALNSLLGSSLGDSLGGLGGLGDLEVDADPDAVGSRAPPSRHPAAPAGPPSPSPTPPPSPRPRKPATPPPIPPAARRPSAATPPIAAPTTPAASPSPRSAGGAGPDERRLRKLYEDYVEARRKNNERIDNVRYETLVKSVQKMIPKLQAKHAGKRIEFEVIVKDGRVGLKPIAKK
ncbi:MAG: hypothetical protein OEY14_16375 [Myxococcales bacterium]|nr:hypothetical protein [Myxococcales bacterium]